VRWSDWFAYSSSRLGVTGMFQPCILIIHCIKASS
jgi:hypothetical protein